jgi:hypothetical protein
LTLAIESGSRWSLVSVRDNAGADIPFTTIAHGDRRWLVLKP